MGCMGLLVAGWGGGGGGGAGCDEGLLALAAAKAWVGIIIGCMRGGGCTVHEWRKLIGEDRVGS
eukprot:scaffold110723_cov18-Tisochrysis_lutea.AAC.2